VGISKGLRDSSWSGMFKRRMQGVELYMLGEGGLDWFEQVMSGALATWDYPSFSEYQSVIIRHV